MERPSQLTGLLGHPLCSWMFRAPSEMDAPTAEFDEEQRMEDLEPGRFKGKEIAGPHLLTIVVQQGAPTTTLLGPVVCNNASEQAARVKQRRVANRGSRRPAQCGIALGQFSLAL